MAVTSVGTPSPQRVTSGFTSVAGAWGASQNRTGGHLLVAVITGGNSGTAFTWLVSELSSTWTQQLSIGNNASGTSQCGIAVFTKTASGLDSAPSFDTSIGGTGAVVVTLFEFAGAYTTVPVDTSGIFQGGVNSGTINFSITTAGNVAAAGEYAISAFTQMRAAAPLTWVETGSGWSPLYEDNVTSVSHTQLNTQSGPTAGTTLSDAGHFSTNTACWGAALLFVITGTPPVPSLDIPPLAPPMIPPQLWDELLAVAAYRTGTVPPPVVPPFTYPANAVPGTARQGFATPGDPGFIPPGQADVPLAVAPPMIPPQLWDELLAVAAYRTAGKNTPSHSGGASLVVTPSLSGTGTRGHSRGAALAVAPAFSANQASPHSRGAALTVTPVLSAAKAGAHSRTTSLAVTPSFHALPGSNAVVFTYGTPHFEWEYGDPYTS